MAKGKEGTKAPGRGMVDEPQAPVRVPASYRERWSDGFGARGWKLDAAADEAEVIAATPHPGERIPTSVFVHDILDHFVPGFALSGHRAEAKALVQLALRTGSDPTPDYQQMVDEDLLRGDCHGEPLAELLPPNLARRLPPGGSDRERMDALRAELGDGLVRASLTARFVELGWAGVDEVPRAWWARGLSYARRTALGLALQRLFERMDARVLEAGWTAVRGELELDDAEVVFRFGEPEDAALREPVAGT